MPVLLGVTNGEEGAFSVDLCNGTNVSGPRPINFVHRAESYLEMISSSC